MNNILVPTFLVTLLLSPGADAFAQVCTRLSPAHTVALLELYTSEGCDSCPPADRFVSQLHADGLSAEQVVPLSLHVDYWDYIGWKDVFASRIFTERQRRLAELAGSRTVYTPEIFIAGRELRGWRHASAATVRTLNRRPARAQIGISLGRFSGGSLPLSVSARAAQPATLFVALYENGLVTRVKAGENRGATLKHDYVVRDWIGPLPLEPSGPEKKAAPVVLPRALNVPNDAARANLGVAVFVQAEDGEVLQALSLPACGS